MSASASAEGRRGPRWWPLLLALAGYGVTILAVWQLWDAPSRQDRVILTVTASFLLSVAVVGWLLLLSRLRWKLRLFGLFGIFLFGLALSQAVKVTGVSGDIVPILGWKWSAPADAQLKRDLPASAQRLVTEESEETFPSFPQFLGAERNATVKKVRLSRDWSDKAPTPIWRQPIGAGWSGFAVVGHRAITLEQRGDEELVVCYDLTSGAVLWSHADRTRFESVIAGDGPRATPTIADARVYTLGATGMLNVLELESGNLIWSRNIVEDNEATVLEYGLSASPLLDGDRIVVVAGSAPGGSLVAYDRESGERLWRAGDDQGRYSSPTRGTLAGSEQILQFYNGTLRGHDPETGAVLWEFAWPTETEETSQPLVLEGDRVFLSSGYGVGAKLLQVSRNDAGGWQAELLWESRGLKAKFTNVVAHEGFLYGLDDGILVCLDPRDGSRRWKRGRYGHGHLLLVEDLLLVVSERGEVALVDPQPDGYAELGRFSAIEGKSWNTPALAGPYLLVRNANEAACYRLPLSVDGHPGSRGYPPG